MGIQAFPDAGLDALIVSPLPAGPDISAGVSRTLERRATFDGALARSIKLGARTFIKRFACFRLTSRGGCAILNLRGRESRLIVQDPRGGFMQIPMKKPRSLTGVWQVDR